MVNKSAKIRIVLLFLLLIIVLSGVFIPPVRDKAVDFYHSLNFQPYKHTSVGNSSKEEVKFPKTNTSLSDEELSKDLGYPIKLPSELIGKYSLSEKWIVSGMKGDTEKIAVGVYKSKENQERAKFILYLAPAKSKYYNLLQSNRKQGEKNQELNTKGKVLYYYESKIPKGKEIIENIGKNSTITSVKPNDLLTVHSLNWEHNGIGYSFTDYGNNVSILDMTQIAQQIISDN